jgi:hypothetical protein
LRDNSSTSMAIDSVGGNTLGFSIPLKPSIH